MTEPVAAELPPQAIPRGRIVRAVSSQLLCRCVGMIASVASLAMTARYLGPDLYGQMTIAIVYIGLWTALADLGIGTIIVRRVTSGRGQLERLVRVNSGLSLIYCVPLTAVAALSGWLIYDDPNVRAMLVVLSGSLLMMTMTVRFEPVFQTTVRFFAVAISDLASRLTMLGCIALLVHNNADLVWFAAAQLIPPAMQLVIQGFAASRHISLRPVFALRETASLLRESLTQMGVLILAVISWRADGVILSLVSTHSEVGVYGLAYTIAFNAVIVSTFFLKSTLSTATELFSRSVGEFVKFMRSSVEIMIFLAVPLAIIGVMQAGPIVELLSGPEFVSRGAPTLALLCVAVALRFVTGTLSQGLIACHEQRFLFRLSLVDLPINLIMNIVLAIEFGAVGAAAALVISELYGGAIAGWWLHRKCRFNMPVNFLLRVSIPAAVCVVTILLLDGHNVILVICTALVSFLAANLIFGPIGPAKLSGMLRGGVNDNKSHA